MMDQEIDTKNNIIPFKEALALDCECGEKLYWEAQFDADGTDYYAYCVLCAAHHRLYPFAVRHEVIRTK